MRGYPKHLNSKQDYLNMLDIDREETVSQLQQLMDSRFSWFQTGALAEGVEGVTDDTHKVVESVERDDEDNEVAVRYQCELMEDENSHFFLIGFTVDEVISLINGDE